MPPLADIQAGLAQAVRQGDPRFAPTGLVGGAAPIARLEIHLRHYRISLQAALKEKFPATAWLLGARLFDTAAGAYIRAHPPRTPCIAEYGRDFPTFVARFGRAGVLPYVEPFARLEWMLGRASIAVDSAPITWREVVALGFERMLDARLALQHELAYLRATHPVDTLIRLYLSGREPETFTMPAGNTFIEVQGTRGCVHMVRLDSGTFAFRAALNLGNTVSIAAGKSLEADPHFDAGLALREVVASGLVISLDLQEIL